MTRVVLAAIVAVSAALHLWRIGEPARPVFDEAHFATYAADYVKEEVFVDIHPPLGKLTYAAALAFTPKEELGRTDFVVFQRGVATGEFFVEDNRLPYDNFPFVRLRLVSALFGVILPLIFYWFLRSIGVGTLGSLIGAVLIALENAFLLETRLILLDGMYLAFGLAGIALYFSQPNMRRALAAGSLWGLALGVKLAAVVFAGPVLISLLFAPGTAAAVYKRRAYAFLAAGIGVLAGAFFTNNIFFSIVDRVSLWQKLGAFGPTTAENRAYRNLSSPLAPLMASLFETFISIRGNVGSASNAFMHESASPWYLWPAMQIPVVYLYAERGERAVPSIVFKGNPVVWYPSTLAVVFALAALPRYIKIARARHDAATKTDKNSMIPSPLLVLLGGYVGALLPFVLFVRRSTFLYHYLPAYLFAIGLLAWGTERVMVSLGKEKAAIGVVLIVSAFAAVFVGFLSVTPSTYGF